MMFMISAIMSAHVSQKLGIPLNVSLRHITVKELEAIDDSLPHASTLQTIYVPN